jgi:tripartite-type tricarboxylate transporter receptor subunit TctC
MAYVANLPRVFLFASIFALPTAPALAADPIEDFYKGKTITLIVGSPAGGIYDTYSRTLAKHMRNHIPGNPNIIAQNMASSGSITAVNHIYNVAPQDGTVIAGPSSTAAIQPLFGIPEAKFDPVKIIWLGSPTSEVGVTSIWHTVPVNSIEDAKKREVIMGSNGPNGNSGFYGKVINDVFKTKIKLIYGYQGLNESFLAMERGEVEGYSSAFWNQLQNTQGALIRDKKIKFILQYGKNPHPGLAGVPFHRDLKTDTAEDRQIFEASILPLVMGYPYILGPNVPPDRVAAIQKAFDATLKDPGFLEEAKKLNLEVQPVTGAEIRKGIADAYGMSDTLKQRLTRLYTADR